AGEFGQMLIQGEKWESLASTKAIVQKAIDQGLAVKNGVELFNLFDSGNLLVIKIINDFYNNLAIGILNLGYIFNPEVIYLGGGITNRFDFINKLNLAINKFSDPKYFKNTKIKLAGNPNDGGLIGAVVNHRNLYKN
ncbi:MAG: ROK family protein, partial [Bacilli bacterium]|nr:ROK family protein [Bacilli bacterium]